ncbi:MAG: hypothetical protein WAS51_14655 [Ilumatobacteraceae bacterium]
MSPKYGVNPSIELCYFCGDETGSIVMPGLIQQKDRFGRAVPGTDIEAPRKAVWNRNPCPRCADLMKQGIVLISVDKEPRPGKEKDEPYRTGRMCVVSEDFIRRAIDKTTAESLVKRRWSYVPDDAWALLGLPASADPSSTKEGE